jgi:CMP-N-acetylneuraminic acid synthetase
MRFPALLIGRGGSRGVPGKNTMPILGRPLMVYPILAAQHSRFIDTIYLSTDDESIRQTGVAHGCELVSRPTDLATDTALVENVVVDGYNRIADRRGERPEIFVLLFCNSATIGRGIIDAGVQQLLDDPSLDSAVSVSPYNEYSPVRAKRLDADGMLVPFIDVDSIDNASCDRDSATTAYFCDCSVWVLRKSCVNLDNGILPFRWTGKRTAPLFQQGALDIDHGYGIAQTEYWLRQNGFGENATPYDLVSAPAEAVPADAVPATAVPTVR